jgi:uncharacterized protein (TIGR02466 family)
MFDLYPVFSYPVYKSKVKYELSKNELSLIKKLPVQNKSIHSITNNSYVLELPELLNLKNYIQNHINVYKNQILQAREEIEIYITQSWVTFSKKDEYHHKHDHPNSYLSGVFYIDNVNSMTQFERRNTIFPVEITPYKQFNIYNCGMFAIPQENNNLILFPSSMEHCTLGNVQNKQRITLSFNTFVKGNLGTEDLLISLKI